MQKVQTELIDIIIELMPGKQDAIINESTDIVRDLEFDSIALVELLNKIEETFGVDFVELPDFLERFDRIGDIAEGILLLQAKQ